MVTLWTSQLITEPLRREPTAIHSQDVRCDLEMSVSLMCVSEHLEGKKPLKGEIKCRRLEDKQTERRRA